MKTGVILFAGDDVHEGPVGSFAANSMLPGMRAERGILNPLANLTICPQGSTVYIIFAGVAKATWKKPGEADETTVRATPGDVLLMPPSTTLRLENQDPHDPFIYVSAEVA